MKVFLVCIGLIFCSRIFRYGFDFLGYVDLVIGGLGVFSIPILLYKESSSQIKQLTILWAGLLLSCSLGPLFYEPFVNFDPFPYVRFLHVPFWILVFRLIGDSIDLRNVTLLFTFLISFYVLVFNFSPAFQGIIPVELVGGDPLRGTRPKVPGLIFFIGLVAWLTSPKVGSLKSLGALYLGVVIPLILLSKVTIIAMVLAFSCYFVFKAFGSFGNAFSYFLYSIIFMTFGVVLFLPIQGFLEFYVSNILADDWSTSSRLFQLGIAIEILQEYLPLGIGFRDADFFLETFDRFYPEDMGIIGVFVAGGILGGLVFMLIVFRILKDLSRIPEGKGLYVGLIPFFILNGEIFNYPLLLCLLICCFKVERKWS